MLLVKFELFVLVLRVKMGRSVTHRTSYRNAQMTNLKFHVHNAGQALPCHAFYGLHLQSVPVVVVLVGLDELALWGTTAKPLDPTCTWLAQLHLIYKQYHLTKYKHQGYSFFIVGVCCSTVTVTYSRLFLSQCMDVWYSMLHNICLVTG